MVYLNKFVAAVKVNGQILREKQNTVLIPFGSEFSVLLKNLDSRRAVAKLSIDGKNVDSDGTGFIIPADGSMEIERFIRAGNLDSGNRFKFIERGKEVEAHRGVTADDGLIRIEFTAERIVKEETIIRRHYVDEYAPRPFPRPRPYPWFSRVPMRGLRPHAASRRSMQASGSPARRANLPTMDSARASLDFAGDPGITVAGSQSNQKFAYGAWFPLESQSEVIVLQLKGIVAGKIVTKPVLVSDKSTCSTCGKANKSGEQFCSKCGTALVLV